jgi:hypothetical protein
MDNPVLYTALAIRKLRPNVGFAMDGTDLKTIIWNAENVEPLDDAEVLAMVEVVKTEEESKEQAKIDAKQSALNKLMALGLTEEEALALGK